MNDSYPTDPSPARLKSTHDYHDPGGVPLQIGRYRVQKIIGKGGFGLVYLAHDDQLQRDVAIKVAHARLIAEPSDAQAYLTEARTVASLDHPNIVPVYDVGASDEFPVFVVSKYIDGSDLFTRLRQSRLPLDEAVELVVTVTEALHHAHKQEIVHRDIKTNNILLDKTDKPFVADFGLALREQDVGKGPRYAGTPAYMSPEQARGEGHRVDGRSDIFSLGVVFYELLTGKRPFKGTSTEELFEQVTTFEPRPPRQLDDQVPKELERICLKALAKRASERFSTAKDMADDLRYWLDNLDGGRSAVKPPTAPAAEPEQAAKQLASVLRGEGVATPSFPPTTPLVATSSDSQPVKIVPKGLRSFDAHDADFFLELLPGPRDRDGLPDSIRFWKTRIEETDADNTFSVGLIYGPSGCGKSSLVKAGLLPHLSPDVIAVYVEATADETESRLVNGLRKRCPGLPDNLSLKETLAALRRGQAVPAGKKVLIVLDQFEQWLHAKKEQQNTDLVQALRQCDGGRVQCVVMVRDDFWLAVSRFLRELEIRLVEGQNSALADLFDPDHARKILAAFGRAFGKLPEKSGEKTKEEKEFLDHAVSGLAQEGKVISVRLALFAEMMKGKAWTPASLRAVGGTGGVGTTFLEETFSAATAPPEHRYHQKAARGVLKALLPESGTDIKGHMRSYAELLAAAGYLGRPQDFADLMAILDSELRLITPTDPEGKVNADESTLPVHTGERFYQLTHDYLVPSLREWLTRKQKETRRGRAELLLADRAVVWNARPENRQLPSLAQWCQIKWLTAKKNWTPPQRKMMRRAGRYHTVRGAAAALLLTVATMTGLAVRDQAEQRHAAELVYALLNADTAQTPAIIAEMAEYRTWTDALLRNESLSEHSTVGRAAGPSSATDGPAGRPTGASRRKLHASLALLPVDRRQVDYLYARLLAAQPHEVAVLRDALAPYKDGLLEKLWAAVESSATGEEPQRLRAAAALAKYDSEGERWAQAQELVGDDLVAVPAVYLSLWMDALRPVRTKLLARLSAIYRDAGRPSVERSLATDILADYAADDAHTLADLLMDADEKQFAAIYPKLNERGEQGLPFLTGEIDIQQPADLPSSHERREKLAKRQANAAVALLRMNQAEKIWPLLKHSPDPRVRSYLIHRLAAMGADAEAIVKRVAEEPDISVRRALLLALGEFDEKELPPAVRVTLLPKLQAMYRTDSDAGLHAAVEWLLRTWRQDEWLNAVNDEWKEDKNERDNRIENIRQLVKQGNEQTPRWYVNSQGQTMVAIPGPVELLMGSPTSEKDRSDDEVQHKRRINRSFAIAMKSVTLAEYRGLTKDPYEIGEEYTRYPDLPVVGINWYMAAKYCNLLSKVEGIDEDQWCYDVKDDEVNLKSNYLGLSGYRLPSEAEMEYATRAEAATSRYYGETKELLGHYAWYTTNSQELVQRVGLKKPNDFGLFDAQGNCYTWCQEAFDSYPTAQEGHGVDDKEVENLLVLGAKSRVLRGGSFVFQASLVRSAFRYDDVPTVRLYAYGFRLARTLPPIPLTSLPPSP